MVYSNPNTDLIRSNLLAKEYVSCRVVGIAVANATAHPNKGFGRNVLSTASAVDFFNSIAWPEERQRTARGLYHLYGSLLFQREHGICYEPNSGLYVSTEELLLQPYFGEVPFFPNPAMRFLAPANFKKADGMMQKILSGSVGAPHGAGKIRAVRDGEQDGEAILIGIMPKVHEGEMAYTQNYEYDCRLPLKLIVDPLFHTWIREHFPYTESDRQLTLTPAGQSATQRFKDMLGVERGHYPDQRSLTIQLSFHQLSFSQDQSKVQEPGDES
jgi:hypothetical protein